MPGAFPERGQDDRRILSDTRISKNAVPISHPGNPTTPRGLERREQWSNAQLRSQRGPNRLVTETRRGDNVKKARMEVWPDDDDEGFGLNTPNKRRKLSRTGESSAWQFDTVDLTGDEQDESLLYVGTKESVSNARTNGKTPPRISSPHQLSGKTSKASSGRQSLKSARSDTSIAADFGKLKEYDSVVRRTTTHRRSYQSGHSATNRSPLRQDPRELQLEDGYNTRRAHPNTTVPARASTYFARSEQAAKVNNREDTHGYSKDEEEEEMEHVTPHILDDAGQRQREIELLRQKSNANVATTRPISHRARATERKNRASTSDADELAADDSSYRIRKQDNIDDIEGLKSRTSAHKKWSKLLADNMPEKQSDDLRGPSDRLASSDDIEPSKFTKSAERTRQSKTIVNGRHTSGYRLKSIASNLLPYMEDTGQPLMLHATGKTYSIKQGPSILPAIEIRHMKTCIQSGHVATLHGPEGAWAAIKFLDIPERSHFGSDLKRLPSLKVNDPGRELANQDYETCLAKHAKDRTPLKATIPGSSTGNETDFILRKRNAMQEGSVARKERPDPQYASHGNIQTGSVLDRRKAQFEGFIAEGAKLRSQTTQSTTKLISQMTISEPPKVHENTVSPPSFKKPVPLKRTYGRTNTRAPDTRPSNDTFSINDDGEVSNATDHMMRRSARKTRQASQYFEDLIDETSQLNVPESERYSRKVGLGPKWQYSLTYPMTGKDRATVEFEDLERLDDGEFLNDNLIEFYLRWARQQQLDAGTYKEGQVHFFNTFFYEKLASGGKTIDYKAVESWTRKVDIFDLDYIVVPVNENAHWYVCIICNLPNFVRSEEAMDLTQDNSATSVYPSGDADIEDLTAQLNQAASGDTALELPKEDLGRGETSAMGSNIQHVEPHKQGTMGSHETLSTVAELDTQSPAASSSKAFSIHTDADASQESIKLTRSDGVFKNAKMGSPKASRTKRRKSGPIVRKYDPTTTIIITLDSLGLTHAKTTSNLKDYIIGEGAAKHAIDIKKDEIRGMNVTRGIPQQQNLSDCGIFLLGYIHKFLADPSGFVRKVLQNEMDESLDWPDMDPSELRANVREIIKKTYQEQLPERQAMSQRRKKRKQQPISAPSSPSDATQGPPKAPSAQPLPRRRDAQGAEPVPAAENGHRLPIHKTPSPSSQLIQDVSHSVHNSLPSSQFPRQLARSPSTPPLSSQLRKTDLVSPDAPSPSSQLVKGTVLGPRRLASHLPKRHTHSAISMDPVADSQPEEDEVALLVQPHQDISAQTRTTESKEDEAISRHPSKVAEEFIEPLFDATTTHNRQRPMFPQNDDEVPDSQEDAAASSNDTLSKEDLRSESDPLARINAIEFPHLRDS